MLLDEVANDLSEIIGDAGTIVFDLLFCGFDPVSTRLIVLTGVIEPADLEFVLTTGVLSPTFFVTGVVTTEGGFFGELTTFFGSFFDIAIKTS